MAHNAFLDLIGQRTVWVKALQQTRRELCPEAPTHTHAYHGMLGLLERTASQSKLSKYSTTAERHNSDPRPQLL